MKLSLVIALFIEIEIKNEAISCVWTSPNTILNQLAPDAIKVLLYNETQHDCLAIYIYIWYNIKIKLVEFQA